MADTVKSDLAEFLKIRYEEKEYELSLLEASRSPLFRRMKKKEDWFSKQNEIYLEFGEAQGASADFSQAQNESGEVMSADHWILDSTNAINEYAIWSVTGKAYRIAKSGNDRDAFFVVADRRVKSSMKLIAHRLAAKAYRSTTGSIAQLASTSGTSTTLTLAEPNMAKLFRRRMNITLSSADGSGKRGAGTYGTTTRVVSSQITTTASGKVGTLEVDTAISSFSGAASDYLYWDGDYSNAPNGLGSCIPTTAPTSGDSHFGVDRSVAPNELAGYRLNATAYTDPVEIAFDLVDLCTLLGDDLELYTTPTIGAAIRKILYDKGIVDIPLVKRPARGSSGDIADLSVEGFAIQSRAGRVTVFEDLYCPEGFMYCCNESLTMYSVGPMPDMLDEDGNEILRKASLDSYESRTGGYYDFILKDPANCGVAFNISV